MRTPRTAVLSEAALPHLTEHVPPWPGEQRGAVFVRRGPDGAEPALLVHGLGGSSLNWTDLQALLAGRLATEAIDLPGFGFSPPSRQGYGLRAHARAVVRRIEERGEGPVHLIGNSMGGAVSVLVAAGRPDLVSSLTLISPALPTLRPAPGSDKRLPLMLLPGIQRLAARQLRAAGPEARVQGVVDLCFADPTVVQPQRRVEMVAEAQRRAGLDHDALAFSGSLRGLVGSYAYRGAEAVWRQLGRVTAPSLVVWGARDRLVSVALATRTASTLPDSRLLVLDEVGHVAQMERPDLVARAVLGLLDGGVSGKQCHGSPGAPSGDCLPGCSHLPHG